MSKEKFWLAPVEPTEEMVDAGDGENSTSAKREYIYDIWNAMRLVAPTVKDYLSVEPTTLEPVAVAPYDPSHPYVRKLIGCGHGRLFSEPCVDCEIVGLMDEYKRAVKTITRVRDRMRQLGRPMPGATS